MLRRLIRSALREAWHALSVAVLLVAVGTSVVVMVGKLTTVQPVSAARTQVPTHVDDDEGPVRTTPPVLHPPAGALNVPILMYHKTPANFEAQLMQLKARGYETVSLDAVAQALKGGAVLPAKPVVITFDDGFADQMKAYEILKRQGMKATFYIINGSERSRWCIGAGRRYGDPLQPASGCGDQYLTWDQVRELDRSGVVEIGAHTMDHADLPILPAELRRWEVGESKAGLERELGHEVRQFAYPYGAYDAATIEAVREAGFETAVTTVAGTLQAPGHEFELTRVRDAYSLP
jgi:peptidoglycan/xylan/chitin deacetylase (PgdA/CDA1 family)